MKRILAILKNGSNYGKLVLLVGLLVGAPLFVLPFYPSETKYMPSFLVPTVFSLLLGFLICAATSRRADEKITAWQSPMQRGSLVILFVWCYSFFMGALPFFISGKLDFLHALFEAVSGWTTAGFAMVDVEAMPRVFLFHRSFMQYCGGLGFILVMAMVVQGKHSTAMYGAEGHSDRPRPSIKKTARAIFGIYNAIFFSGALAYRICGMEGFDAVCHAMSALSTAGFSTQPGSIGGYGSFAVEMTTIVLMLAGASNFAVLLLLAQGKIRRVLRVTEIRFMFAVLALFVPLCAFSLAAGSEMGLGESFRHALFGVVAILSTTGYHGPASYLSWPPFALGLIFLLMMVGGSAGSTSGGIKLSRTYFLLRMTRENIMARLSPSIRRNAPLYHTIRGRTPIDDALVADTFGFAACYIGVFFAGALTLTLTAGCSLPEAMFEFASVLSTAGITSGITHQGASAATLAVEMVGMILGRLEILTVFFGLHSAFGIIKKKLSH